MNTDTMKQVFKLLAELIALALVAALLQLLVIWVGFKSAWPILLFALICILIILMFMRKK